MNSSFLTSLAFGMFTMLLFNFTGQAQKMYWTDNGFDEVRRANLDGSDVEVLVATGGLYSNPTGVAIDAVNGKLYWTDVTPRIGRANLDGSAQETLIAAGDVITPTDITLDIAGGKIYWTDNGFDEIRRANLDGSDVETVLSTGNNRSNPTDLALDAANGKVYWTDLTPRIARANLDGSNQETLLTTGEVWVPTGIALDLNNGKVYWSDNGYDEIRRADLDGSNVEILLTTGDPFSNPTDLAVDGVNGKLYWTDLNPRIGQANLDGSGEVTLLSAGDLAFPLSIALLCGAPAGGGVSIGAISATCPDNAGNIDVCAEITSATGLVANSISLSITDPNAVVSGPYFIPDLSATPIPNGLAVCFSYNPADNGIYDLTFSATDNCGNTSTQSQNMLIDGSAVVNLIIDEANGPVNINVPFKLNGIECSGAQGPSHPYDPIDNPCDACALTSCDQPGTISLIGPVNINAEIKFNNTTLCGDIIINNSSINEDWSINNTHFTGDLIIIDSEFNDKVTINNAVIASDLIFDGVTQSDKFDINNTCFKGEVKFDGMNIDAKVKFNGADVCSDLLIDTDILANTTYNKKQGHDLFEVQAAAFLPESKEDLLRIYPNPFSTSATIEYQVTASDQIELALHDVTGKKVFTVYTGEVTAGQTLTFNLGNSGLSGGLYFLSLQSSSQVILKKIVYRAD